MPAVDQVDPPNVQQSFACFVGEHQRFIGSSSILVVNLLIIQKADTEKSFSTACPSSGKFIILFMFLDNSSRRIRCCTLHKK